MLTVVLAPVDRSVSAGSEEMSNPLRIASFKWAEGSAPMASSCLGSAPSLSPSWSEGGRATKWGGSSFGPGMSPGLPLVSLSDSSVSGTWVRKDSCFSCLTTGLGINIAGAGPCSAPLGDPPRSSLGVDSILRCGRGGSWRISVPLGRSGSWLPSGHTGFDRLYGRCHTTPAHFLF